LDLRRTKIIATLGPSSRTREVVRELVAAGMDVARLNFSHGTHGEHAELIALVREEADRAGRPIAVLQDLQGPKIRVGEMNGGGVLLHKGMRVVLTSEPVEVSNREVIHVSYPPMADEVVEGGRILMDDGHIELEVQRVEGREVHTEVVVGGPLRSRKGVNLPMTRSAAGAMTEKDIRDLAFGLDQGVEFVALSFVRTGDDVRALTARIRESGKPTAVVAKIEKPEAVAAFEDVLSTSDAIMVARGDLGIEIPMQRVPIVQKRLIRRCLRAATPVITATQMLESMMDNPRPTRAEASDVANAVLDGSDALMLSGETAAGKYPVRAVEVMDEIIRSVEGERRALGGQEAASEVHSPSADARVTQAISFTAVKLAQEVGAVAVCCLTHSGTTARAIARHRPDVPIYAFTDDPGAVRRMALLWGTDAIAIPSQNHTDAGLRAVHHELLERGLVVPGDRLVVTAGLPLPAKGLTNMVHVSIVGEGWDG
jgi:pyruvate kinase